MSWSDNKELLSGADVIGWNSRKKKRSIACIILFGFNKISDLLFRERERERVLDFIPIKTILTNIQPKTLKLPLNLVSPHSPKQHTWKKLITKFFKSNILPNHYYLTSIIRTMSYEFQIKFRWTYSICRCFRLPIDEDTLPLKKDPNKFLW